MKNKKSVLHISVVIVLCVLLMTMIMYCGIFVLFIKMFSVYHKNVEIRSISCHMDVVFPYWRAVIRVSDSEYESFVSSLEKNYFSISKDLCQVLLENESDWIPVERVEYVYEGHASQCHFLIVNERITMYAYVMESTDGYRDIYLSR